MNEPPKRPRGRPPLGPVSAHASICFRVTEARKTRWTQAALALGITLTELICRVCDRATAKSVRDRVTEIECPDGRGRVWEASAGAWSWAAADGRQGAGEPTFEAAVARLRGGQIPYTLEQMAAKTYTVKVQLRDMSWVKVQTNTEWVSNGLMEKAWAEVTSGRCEKCGAPSGGEKAIYASKPNLPAGP